jgi:hypothetical protein
MVDPRGAGGGLVPLSTLGQHTPGERGGGARRGGAPPSGPRQYGGTELTAVGERRRLPSSGRTTPVSAARPPASCFDWTFDGPVNRITQGKDTVVIQYGQMGLKRTVYMNLKDHPAGVQGQPGRPLDWAVGGRRAGGGYRRFLPGVLNAPVRHGTGCTWWSASRSTRRP